MRIVLLVLAVFLPSAQVAVEPLKLDQVATILAKQPAKVLCYAHHESGSPNLDGDWGFYDGAINLDSTVCAGALDIERTAHKESRPVRALGALVLMHESLHQRWPHASEATVECYALVNFKHAVYVLGGRRYQAGRLYPYAVKLHRVSVASFPAYRKANCPV